MKLALALLAAAFTPRAARAADLRTFAEIVVSPDVDPSPTETPPFRDDSLLAALDGKRPQDVIRQVPGVGLLKFDDEDLVATAAAVSKLSPPPESPDTQDAPDPQDGLDPPRGQTPFVSAGVDGAPAAPGGGLRKHDGVAAGVAVVDGPEHPPLPDPDPYQPHEPIEGPDPQDGLDPPRGQTPFDSTGVDGALAAPGSGLRKHNGVAANVAVVDGPEHPPLPDPDPYQPPEQTPPSSTTPPSGSRTPQGGGGRRTAHLGPRQAYSVLKGAEAEAKRTAPPHKGGKVALEDGTSNPVRQFLGHIENAFRQKAEAAPNSWRILTTWPGANEMGYDNDECQACPATIEGTNFGIDYSFYLCCSHGAGQGTGCRKNDRLTCRCWHPVCAGQIEGNCEQCYNKLGDTDNAGHWHDRPCGPLEGDDLCDPPREGCFCRDMPGHRCTSSSQGPIRYGAVPQCGDGPWAGPGGGGTGYSTVYMCEPDYHFKVDGFPCEPVPERECEAAVNILSGLTSPTLNDMRVAYWNTLPCACFLWGGQSPIYNTNDCDNENIQVPSQYQRVVEEFCKGSPPTGYYEQTAKNVRECPWPLRNLATAGECHMAANSVLGLSYTGEVTVTVYPSGCVCYLSFLGVQVCKWNKQNTGTSAHHNLKVMCRNPDSQRPAETPPFFGLYKRGERYCNRDPDNYGPYTEIESAWECERAANQIPGISYVSSVWHMEARRCYCIASGVDAGKCYWNNWIVPKNWHEIDMEDKIPLCRAD